MNFTALPKALQLYKHNAANSCAVPVQGSISGGTADSVILRVYSDSGEKLFEGSAVVYNGNGFSFANKITANTTGMKFLS